MNLILSTILIFNIHSADSLRLFYHDRCNDSIWLNKSYYLIKDGNTEKIKVNPQTGICLVPSVGGYKLFLIENEYPLTYQYNGQKSDTLFYPKLYFGVPTILKRSSGNYVDCDIIANGYKRDFFKVNKKRVEGNFRNGRLNGKFTYYDLDGKVVKLEYDPRKKKIHKSK